MQRLSSVCSLYRIGNFSAVFNLAMSQFYRSSISIPAAVINDVDENKQAWKLGKKIYIFIQLVSDHSLVKVHKPCEEPSMRSMTETETRFSYVILVFSVVRRDKILFRSKILGDFICINQWWWTFIVSRVGGIKKYVNIVIHGVPLDYCYRFESGILMIRLLYAGLIWFIFTYL